MLLGDHDHNVRKTANHHHCHRCCRCHWKNLPAAKRSMMAMTSCSLLNSSLSLFTSTRYRSIKSLALETNGFHFGNNDVDYDGNNDDVDYEGDGASLLSTSHKYWSIKSRASSSSSSMMTRWWSGTWGQPHQGSLHVRQSQLQTTRASHETCQTLRTTMKNLIRVMQDVETRENI